MIHAAAMELCGQQVSATGVVEGQGRLARGFGLVKDSKWLDAMDFFKAMKPSTPPVMMASRAAGVSKAGSNTATAQAASQLVSSGSAQQLPAAVSAAVDAMVALCHAKLGLPEPQAATKVTAQTGLGSGRSTGGTGVDASSSSDTHPAQHLALAITSAAPSTQAGSMTALRQQQVADSLAVGHALAFLLHPATREGHMPSSLVDDAWKLLSSKASVWASPGLATAAGSSAAAVSASGASSNSRTTVRKAWEERAKKVPSLKKLLELTGLASVKEEMFSLADQVGVCVPSSLVAPVL